MQQFRNHRLTPPLWQAGGLAMFPLGTDELGRCLLSRLLFGGRLSLWTGAAAVMLALPGLLLAIAVISIPGPGLVNTVIAIAIAVGALPGYVRLTRAAALSALGKDCVTASRKAGAGTLRFRLPRPLPAGAGPLQA